jgi:hypothetical protein
MKMALQLFHNLNDNDEKLFLDDLIINLVDCVIIVNCLFFTRHAKGRPRDREEKKVDEHIIRGVGIEERNIAT